MSKSSASTVVSVIVTTKNNQETLGVCLQSIIDQDYKNLELIVVDNKSSDDTIRIAKLYTKHVFTKGPERSAQRNFGVSKSTGAYVMIIDSDMVLSSSVVSECVNTASADAQAITIPEESFGIGFWAKCKALERSFYNGVEWMEAPRFFSKKAYVLAGGYDEDISGGEDWDLRNRIAQLTLIGRIESNIKHDEGHLNLTEIVRSRKYYAKGFKKHYDKPLKKGQKSGATQAISIFKLFLSRPNKLFQKPVLGICVLFMKSLEFGTVLVYSRGTKLND